MKFLAFIILFSFSNTLFARVCSDDISTAKKKLAEIESNIKEGKDITSDFEELEKIIAEKSDCLSYSKLGLKGNKVASFRKYISAPDRSFNLKEADCTEYKVDTSNMPKNNNQGPLGWCFAFSTTDLFSFHEKTAFSAYDVALFHHNEFLKLKTLPANTDYSDTGGSAMNTSIFINNSDKGLCLESNFNEENTYWFKMSEMMANLTKPNVSLSVAICENKFNEQVVFEKLSIEVLKLLDQLSTEKKVAAILDLTCKERRNVKGKYQTKSLNLKDDDISKEELMGSIDGVLKSGEPVSISYASDLLTSGVNFQGEADHASTLIGRKFNKANGQCEYLIKNSWGGECKNAESLHCENGNYWVPRTALKNNINSATWIKPKP